MVVISTVLITFNMVSIRFGAMDVTKPYEFIGFGALEGREMAQPSSASGP